jgi:hypothetical protein
MKLRAVVCAGALAVATLAADYQPTGIVQARVGPKERSKFAKLLVLGISDDRQTRHRFEDKLVTHLRARGVEAITSYSIVEDLTKPADRDQILAVLEAEKVEGALTARAVGMEASGEDAWAQKWSDWLDAPATIRDLVQASIPVPTTKAKRYGVEITLWEFRNGTRPWSARTSLYERKKLREAASGLMQDTIARLRELKLI